MGCCVVDTKERSTISKRIIQPEEIEGEIERFEHALVQTSQEIEEISLQVKEKMGVGDANIFETHQMVLSDQMLIDEVTRTISEQHLPADLATEQVMNKYIRTFENMTDDFFRQRVEDVKDIGGRLIDNLIGWKQSDLLQLEHPSIVVAADLTPSRTVQMDRTKLLGLITEQGGTTSHVAILARSLQIPAVTGIPNVVNTFKTGQYILLDGFSGNVIISPSEKTRLYYGRKIEQERVLSADLEGDIDKPTSTLDGRNIGLEANLTQPGDVDRAALAGVHGVGLFRTEFFFFNQKDTTTPPTEEEQYKVYRRVALTMGDKPVIIRTLDVGGDKIFSSIQMAKEENPFLGVRAIRFCLKSRPDIFKTQLRALLRAGAEAKNLKIMYPMISGLGEFDAAQEMLHVCMNELEREGIAYNKDISVGIMMEIPSAVLCANELARKADFFSIGTNDLIQYTLAVDRMNPMINYLYKPTHPAVIRLIYETVRAARHGKDHESIPVAVCGEMGGTPELAPLLIGLGVDELSVGIPQVDRMRRIIRKVVFEECRMLALEAMQLQYPEDILSLSVDFARRAAPELFQNID